MSNIESPHIPLGLDLVIDYVNSLDIEQGADDLATPRDLARWLGQRDLLRSGVAVRPAEHAAAIRLREALRALLAANNGVGEAPAAAWEQLELAARESELAVAFGPGTVLIAPHRGGVAGALGRILVPVAGAVESGVWERVKACRSPDCRWAFYDRSRNRSGAWCEMAVCGNRTKVRRYRRRAGGGSS